MIGDDAKSFGMNCVSKDLFGRDRAWEAIGTSGAPIVLFTSCRAERPGAKATICAARVVSHPRLFCSETI